MEARDMEKGMDRRYLDELAPLLRERFGAAADEILTDAWTRYGQLCAENAGEPKKVWMHTRKRIYPAVAAFDALLKHGLGRGETADLLNGYYIQRAEGVGRKIQKAMSFPGLYRLVPKFFGAMTRSSFGQAAGFQARWHAAGWREMRFDMLVCPYQDACVRYGCPEIVQGFCRADDACYGNMHPRLKWGRTKTLGQGGDCCDFRMSIVK